MPTANATTPTPVQKRGTPVCTSTANATNAATISPNAHQRTGSATTP